MESVARAGLASVVRGWRFSRADGPICVIGDVHGHRDKLLRLWGKLPGAVGGAHAFDSLQVVFLGDYCDKGPDSKGVLETLVGLRREHPGQKHYFLCGNHDFALSAFLGCLPEPHDVRESLRSDGALLRNESIHPSLEGLASFAPPKQGDYSGTWRKQYESKFPGNEQLYTGPGSERMHLQGVRYAARAGSVFDSAPTFASYGVAYGDREGLLRAMPPAHLEFLCNLRWIVKLRGNIGDVLCVHAGLEDESLAALDKTVNALRLRDPALLHRPFIEPLCGRANVERLPTALLAPILQKRGYLPPPLFLISGHHGFVRLNGKRIILDQCAGHADRDLAGLVLERDGAGGSHTQLSNDNGLSIKILTSSPNSR